ncbi:GGDEF domain-containing protein [Campylobacterota bacterium DY0563]
MKTIFSILEKRTPKTITKLSFVLILILGVMQFLFRETVTIAPLYIFPILFSSWYGSKITGILSAFLSTLVFVVIETTYNRVLPTFNELLLLSAPYLTAYLLLAILIINFRDVHRIEVYAADTDNLTGLHSARSFYVELANELLRSKRYNHVFSLAYLDVDNFKNINDSLGHIAGDKLLKEVANCLVSSLRATDVIARLGGDEYACLLHETNQQKAKSAFLKTVDLLNKRMVKNKWDVSFSIGVMTFENIPEDIKEAIDLADKLMYSVKNDNKDNIAYQTY